MTFIFHTIIFSILSFSLCVFPLFASEIPEDWPWRGIGMSSNGTKPSNVPILIKKLGINSIALQIKPRLRAIREKVSPQNALELEFKWVRSMLDSCKNNGINAILVFYEFPIDPKLNINQKDPEFWNNSKHVSDMINLSDVLANTFKKRGSELAGYQIQSEPSIRFSNEAKMPAIWPETLEKIILTIRAKDPNRWIAVSLTLGGAPNGYDTLKPLQHDRIIYNAHLYLPHQFTHQGLNGLPVGVTYPGRIGLTFKLWNKNTLKKSLEPIINFKKKFDVPIWIGEFSAARWAPGSEQYLIDVVDLFEKAGFGWSYFAFGGANVWNPDYNIQYSKPEDEDTWKRHYVGETSLRWKTLKNLYNIR